MIFFFDDDMHIKGYTPPERMTSAIREKSYPDDYSKFMSNTVTLEMPYDPTIEESSFFAVPKDLNDLEQGFSLYSVQTEKATAKQSFTGTDFAPTELNQSFVSDLRPSKRSIDYMINQIMTASGLTDWTLRDIDASLLESTASTSFYYLSVKECFSKIQELFSCYFIFTVDIDNIGVKNKYIDVVKDIGVDTGKRFTYGSNALTVDREISRANIITGLIGRGKGEEKTSEDAETGDTTTSWGRRINFKDVVWSVAKGDPVDKPAGQEYVELPEATASMGIVQKDGTKKVRLGLEIFENETNPDNLLIVTYNRLLTLSRPLVEMSSTVVKLEGATFGDTVDIIRHDRGYYYTARIFYSKEDLTGQNVTQVKVGDSISKPVTDSNAKIRQTLATLPETVSQAASQASQVASQEAASTATGANGGNILISKDSSGKPLELLIMDATSLDAAKLIAKWNKSGLWFTSTGYEANEWVLAWGINAKINKQFVETNSSQATITSPNITGGTISNSTLSGVTIKSATWEGIQDFANGIGLPGGTIITAAKAVFGTLLASSSQLGLVLDNKLFPSYVLPEDYIGDIGEYAQAYDSTALELKIDIAEDIRKYIQTMVTVDDSIPDYQVFITNYGTTTLSITAREVDYFTVKTSAPGARFGWEIKAKRRGYTTRLKTV